MVGRTYSGGAFLNFFDFLDYTYCNTYCKIQKFSRLLVSFALLAEVLANERSERDTLRSVQSRIVYILLGMCSFQHKWASELQLYLFVLLHHFIMK